MRIAKLSLSLFLVPYMCINSLKYTRGYVSMKTKNINSNLYLPKNDNQCLYVKKLQDRDTDLIIGVGPAGTGKTLFPCQEAVHQLIHNDKKIVMTRPMVSVNEDIGFLPGNINKKMDPWVRPLLDILEEYYTPPQVENLLKYKKIEIVPLGFMRGRTFKNSFIIGDEMQNATPEQMLMLLTRIGSGSKMVLTGDLAQSDVYGSGLNDVLNKLENYYHDDVEIMYDDGISIIRFNNNDILRHKFVSKIIDIYD